MYMVAPPIRDGGSMYRMFRKKLHIEVMLYEEYLRAKDCEYVYLRNYARA